MQHSTRRPTRFTNAFTRRTAVAMVGVLVLASLLTSCGSVGPAASTSPSPSGSAQSPEPSPSVSAEASPTASPTPSRTAVPTTSPAPSRTPAPTTSPTQAPPSWAHVEWSDPRVPFPYRPPVGVGGSGTTTTINDVTDWKGGYVGVGTIDRDGACAAAGFFRSADGLHWERTFRAPSGQDHTPTMCPRFLAKVGGGLIALGQERIWRSNDGIAWTELDSTSLRSLWGQSGAEELVAMAAGTSGMVVIGQRSNTFESIVAFSANGTHWTPITLPARKTAIAWDATANQDGFVVVGRDGQPDETALNTRAGVGSPTAWLSSDGKAWREVEVTGEAVQGGVLSRVLPMAAGLFAIGNDVGVTIYEEVDAVGAWTSADGRSWEKAGTLEGLVPKAALLESDGTDLVALRNGKAMWVSTDGRDWRPVSTTGDLQVPSDLLGPVQVQPASPMSHDTPMWVTDRELIFGYPVDSPEGFAVVQLQLGITSP